MRPALPGPLSAGMASLILNGSTSASSLARSSSHRHAARGLGQTSYVGRHLQLLGAFTRRRASLKHPRSTG